MKNTAIFLALILGLSGCLNLRTEYPDVKYYELKQTPVSISKIDTIPGALQIRHINISGEFDSDAILARWGETRVQRYNYHRWISNVSGLVTDYLVERYSRAGAFSNGVIKPTSMILPDYILEGQVIEMIAVNSESEEPGSNYVVFSMKVNLLKRNSLKIEKQILLTETYHVEVPRKNNKVATIPPAFSKAVGQVADMLFVDIQQAITKYERKISKTK
jgi:ABC-type uncharacterized transport system auxiliary subunit